MFTFLATCAIVVSVFVITSLIAGTMVERSIGDSLFFEEHF